MSSRSMTAFAGSALYSERRKHRKKKCNLMRKSSIKFNFTN